MLVRLLNPDRLTKIAQSLTPRCQMRLEKLIGIFNAEKQTEERPGFLCSQPDKQVTLAIYLSGEILVCGLVHISGGAARSELSETSWL